jgi:hypothetical protein
MKKVGLYITCDEGVNDFLGVHVDKTSNGKITLTQPRLIRSILEDLRLTQESTATKETPAPSTVKLRRHEKADIFDGHFHYRSVIGKLNFLEKSTRPDMSYSVHQCARYSATPKAAHGKAVKHIGRYLFGTKTDGIILHPDTNIGFEIYADADFAGTFNPLDDPHRDMARSRTGFVIFYAGCPIFWQSKLQTEIALSTTEAEIISLSASLRVAIPLLEIAKEMKKRGYLILSNTPKVLCRAFEDNDGAVELATSFKYRPRTRYFSTKFFHFKQYIERKEIIISPCPTDKQKADIFTKPLETPPFKRHRFSVNGW